ncbi:MAG: flagellar hook protein FlgE [Melioribacteraceae bacterium]|nr:flagellar hook protein FlgE [Melioribacteraceae bacterium]MCF8392465.1 flagellar hook protein FlgE [Melioribacteraceae bacterium]MCF8418376.1 flagellar hook protein FlgE [Melioribacteraceae bacterium]
MSLLNSLFSGVSGLRNHQSMMDVVGNNIANVNSIGYKGSRVTFSDTFNNFVRFGSNPTDTSGGTNAFQIGLGMKISSIDRNWNQGTFERTGITTDLALQGNGLFILENNGEKFYSRAGAFAFDANGKLVNPQNGSIVQGKLATEDGVIPPGNNLDDIVVDANLKLPAEATTLTSWGGNLNSMASLTRTEKYAQSGNINASMAVGDTITDQNTIYDFNGNAYTLQTSYEKTAADTYDLTYELVDEAGTSILGPTTAEAVFDADGNLATLDGAAASTISLEDSAIGINFQLDVSEVTQLDSAATLSSTVDDNREPTIVNGTVTVYDSLGNPHNLTITFTKTASNSWNWNTEVPASSGTLSSSSGSIVFNSDGSINTISPNPPVVSLTPSGGASVQNIKLNFGESFGGITQTSSDSVISALSQNGTAAATLSNLSIDQYGYIVGVFSNGQSRKLAQLMLATFPNLNGLTSVGDNMFTVSANAGDPLIGEPGEATGTTIQSGALEQSNVDLSEEFTRMIVAQRGFQANARVVTTSDSLLQEITNLVR